MRAFVIRVLVNALAIYVAASIVPGIFVRDTVTALVAGLVLGLVNAFVRPVLLVLTLPVTVVTLGLFLFLLNGLLLLFTSWLVKGFAVQGLWAAVLGSLLITVVSWVATAFVGGGRATA